jgi:hypothetical protein
MSDERTGQGESTYSGYRGGQVKRGGGEFYGGDGHEIEAALRHAGLSPEQMAAAQPDQVDLAFAPVREAAKAIPSMSSIIDLLQAELRKGAQSQPEVCANYIRFIATLLPGGVGICKKTLEVLPPDMLAVALMRQTLDQLP